MAAKKDRPIPFPKCIKGIQGLLHRNEAKFLYDTPARLGDGLYGDIGTFRGRSAAAMAGGMKDNGVTGHVFTVDNYIKRNREEQRQGVAAFMQKIRDSLEANGVGSYITLVAGDSAEVAADHKDKEFNFIFIDGDHRYEGVKADFEAWSPLVRSGGEIGFHDCQKPEIDRVVEESGWELVNHIYTLKVIKKP